MHDYFYWFLFLYSKFVIYIRLHHIIIIIIIIIYSFRVFHINFSWSLSDSKSRQVSWTLLSILAVLNNAVIWMVSTCSRTSKSCSRFNNPVVTAPKAPITIDTIVTFMFYSIFSIP